MAKIIIKDGEISSSAGINVPGSLTISGNVILGDNFTDTLTVNSTTTFNDELVVKDILSGTTANFSTVNVGTISATNFVGLPPSAGGATTPGGTDTAIQFNKQNAFSGSANLTYDYTSNILSGTTAQFTTITSSNLFISSSGNVTIDVSNTSPALRVTQRGTGAAIRIEDSANPDTTPFIISTSGFVGIGTDSPNSRLDIRGNTTISGAALLFEGSSYIQGAGGESGIYNFKYIRGGDQSLYLAGNSTSSGTIYLNTGGGFINCFAFSTGSFDVNGNILIKDSGIGTSESKLEIRGTKPYITMATTSSITTPTTDKAVYWADSVRKEPYFENDTGDALNLADGGGTTLMRMQGFSTANLTSTKTLVSNTTYALYLGKCPKYILSGDIVTAKYRATTQAATITWAEVALATGAFVSSGPSLLTTRGSTSLASVVNTTGIKSTNITTNANIVPGTDLWLLFGVQATTPGVYRAASIADDIQTGVQLAAASIRPSTMAAGTSFTVEGATTLPMLMSLKV